ncbi:uncharacterized protein N7479_004826 [Penicillium vulpinum]|uniref:uncharacterized protein n=1 Tax=Penicillium vulpinum TaxID=29845 RepID=UPI002549BF31|nr:uncharacterized protein N7479_004826 [Penicillium vulpinum]KAJ5964950.1 hypothetical protein N7479_004826 [Penicillium vulpinum]
MSVVAMNRPDRKNAIDPLAAKALCDTSLICQWSNLSPAEISASPRSFEPSYTFDKDVPTMATPRASL